MSSIQKYVLGEITKRFEDAGFLVVSAPAWANTGSLIASKFPSRAHPVGAPTFKIPYNFQSSWGNATISVERGESTVAGIHFKYDDTQKLQRFLVQIEQLVAPYVSTKSKKAPRRKRVLREGGKRRDAKQVASKGLASLVGDINRLVR